MVRRKGPSRVALSSTSVPNLDDLDADLDDLNNCLEILAQIYPEHEIDVCRQNLLTASKESRLEAVANILADLSTEVRSRPHSQRLEPWQRFRTQSYKGAVSNRICLEFGRLSQSTIRAVLAENNYDYIRSRDSLSVLSSRSWRISLLSFFSRFSFKNSSTTQAPLIASGCPELDGEIDSLLNSESRKEQLASDAELARTINEELHRAANALFECQCCFAECAWEDICFCAESHYFCRRCIQTSVEESLHGQGSGLDYARGSVRCISSTAYPPCTASVSPPFLPHFLTPEVVVALEDRLARFALDNSGMQFMRCPFCPYAIVDETPPYRINLRRPLSATHVFACSLIAVSDLIRLTTTAFMYWIAAWVLFWACMSLVRFPLDVQRELDKVMRSRQRPAWEIILRCANSQCQRSSCLRCGREWKGIHKCSEEEIGSKRVYVERRVDEAVKRTCPQCHLSFVKSGGCNKMTCQCGYKMCYICRADIREEAYNHFCRHFRPTPGTSCSECMRCLLFEDVDDDDVIRVARVEAEKEWEMSKGAPITVSSIKERTPGSHLIGWEALLFKFCLQFDFDA